VALLAVCLLPILGVALAVVFPASSSRPIRLFVGFAPWFALAALVCVGLAALLLRERRGAIAGALCVIALITLVVHGVVTARLVGAGLAEGVLVNPWSTTEQAEARDAPDAVFTYDGTTSPGLRIYAWRPKASSGTSPVMVYVHGGGWTGGRPTDRSTQLRWFADNGWLVLAPEYPLSGPDRHLWDSTVPRIGCALSWARVQTPGLAGDPSRLVLAGDSAGANLAINAAYQAASGSLTSTCGGTPAAARAVVGLYPVVDPVGFHDVGGELGSDARRMTEDYTGGAPTTLPERYRSVASATYISANAPPTLLLVPGADRLVPPEGAEEFADRARGVGVDVTLVGFPSLEHGFDVAPLPEELFREVTLRWLGAHLR
jgi:acetyl esterase